MKYSKALKAFLESFLLYQLQLVQTMLNQQKITGGPSYSRDLWDIHGIKMISERIDKSKKAMKSLRDFFQDSANMSFRNASTMHKLTTMNISQSEFGTLKFVQDRYCELIGIHLQLFHRSIDRKIALHTNKLKKKQCPKMKKFWAPKCVLNAIRH